VPCITSQVGLELATALGLVSLLLAARAAAIAGPARDSNWSFVMFGFGCVILLSADGITPEMGKRVHDDGTRFDLCLSDDPDFFQALREKLLLEKQIGLEYIDFHLRLPPRYLNSGGECVFVANLLVMSAHHNIHVTPLD
jgi:hypothetical protein